MEQNFAMLIQSGYLGPSSLGKVSKLGFTIACLRERGRYGEHGKDLETERSSSSAVDQDQKGSQSEESVWDGREFCRTRTAHARDLCVGAKCNPEAARRPHASERSTTCRVGYEGGELQYQEVEIIDWLLCTLRLSHPRCTFRNVGAFYSFCHVNLCNRHSIHFRPWKGREGNFKHFTANASRPQPSHHVSTFPCELHREEAMACEVDGATGQLVLQRCWIQEARLEV